ncbi:MAG TPA: aldehyde dehydrogenase family protein, partial [Acidimicrobiales bacterium]|nr:aldehyde dehydrogenase family protein [Acidimicrobiales bacterium]
MLGEVPVTTPAVAGRAVARAGQARAEWADVPRPVRAGYLLRLADALLRRRDEVVTALADEIGKPVAFGAVEVDRAVELLRITARLFGAEEPEEVVDGSGVVVRRRPVGVVALVTPWNNPVSLAAGKLGPALAWGNTAVWKPALQAPAASLLLVEAASECGFPEGVVNAVLGDWTTAEAIVADPGVDAVSITASTATGRVAAALCGRLVKPIQAELGGNNAAIVLADADLPRAAAELASAAYGFAGQRCTATRRLIVARDVAREFLDAYRAAAADLELGDPHAPDTDVGPLVSPDHQLATARRVEEALGEGGQVLFAGEVPAGLAGGCFFPPTLVRPAGAESRLVQEETFAPVATFQVVDSVQQAVGLANSVDQGLAASLYSDQVAAQQTFLREMRAGMLKLNRPPTDLVLTAPFGGWKAS